MLIDENIIADEADTNLAEDFLCTVRPPYYERKTIGCTVEFEKLTGLHMDAGVGVDTSYHLESWKDVSPLCEIVTIDFDEARARKAAPVEVAAPAIPGARRSIGIGAEGLYIHLAYSKYAKWNIHWSK